jgi:hypothetical protein
LAVVELSWGGNPYEVGIVVPFQCARILETGENFNLTWGLKHIQVWYSFVSTKFNFYLGLHTGKAYG